MNYLLKFDRVVLFYDHTASISDFIKQEISHTYYLSGFNFSVELSNNKQQFIYKSSIALQLAKIEKKSPQLIAENIVNNLVKSNLKESFLVRISDQGWLEFVMLDRTLNHWLNQIYPLNIPRNTNIKKEKKQISFINIYTHTRCCSLLKSAHRHSIISLDNLDLKTNQWTIKKPEIINYKTLLKSEKNPQELIRELIIIREKINNQKLNYQNTLNNLSQKILEFESSSRIWGETLQQNISLSQAKLGLIALSLHYYQNIFQAEFNQELPQEIF
jgi:arginyl-tRNA synthetase